MKELLSLIKNYQKYIEQGVKELRNEFSCENILECWKQGSIPRSGILASQTKYEFHGVGCFLIINNIEVDFDFGPNNRIDGFDLWRLSLFVEDNPQLKSIYNSNLKLLEEHFDKLKQSQLIHKPNWHPGSSLYYFVEDQYNTDKSQCKH